MMCTCRNCWVMTLAVGLLVSALAGLANAEQKNIPNRMAVAEDVRSDASLDSAIPDPEMTLRGGGTCDSPALCDGDANGDGVVDPLDSGAILARFGLDPCDASICQYDVNCDGTIDPLDTGYVLARFGVCNSVPDCSTPGCTPPAPANDNCADAIEVFEGDTAFSTIGATDDGPADCDADTGHSDIWYHYTSTVDGNIVVTLCDDTDYDSSLSVYTGTDCPVGAAVACSDDDCGVGGGPSELTVFSLAIGDVITIRVGGWNNGDFPESEQGTGTLTVKTSGGPCCFAHDLPGCDEIEIGDPAEVEACVCKLDSFCCEVVWDETCALFVEQFGCGECPFQCNCCEANGGIGCDEPACEALICDLDPFCCDVAWDGICGDEATVCCECCSGDPSDPDCEPPKVCGQPDAGDCCVGNGSPGCDDEFCCLSVCPIDPTCCDVEWTDACADLALQFCDICP